MPRRVTYLVLLGLLIPASGMLAQFGTYTAPGSLAQIPGNRKEAVEKRAEEARWKVGRLRLDPWVGTRDAGWVDDGARDLQGKKLDPDFTATIGAGLRAYLRSGPKVIWAAHALPEYVYWVDRSDRRQTVGRYGVGLFGNFNHLSVEATAFRSESQGQVTSASFARVDNRQDRAALDLDLRLTGSISILVGGAANRFRFSTGTADPDFAAVRALDRDETLVRAGARYRRPSGLSFSAGYQRSRNDFPSDLRNLANDASAPFIEAGYDGPNLKLQANAARWTIEPRATGIASIEETTGLARLTVAPEGRLSSSLYYSRGLAYTFSTFGVYQVEDRYGAQLVLKAGRRTTLAGLYEVGTDDYRTGAGTPALRQDDLTAWGILGTLQVSRGLAIALGGTWTKYSSNLPGFDREERQLRIGLALGGLGEAWN